MAKLDFQKIGMRVAGVSAGSAASGMLLKYLNTQDKIGNTAKGLIMIGLGALAPEYLGKKNDLVRHAGDGVIAIGAAYTLGQAGVSFVPTVSGPEDEYVVSGYDEIEGTEDEMPTL